MDIFHLEVEVTVMLFIQNGRPGPVVVWSPFNTGYTEGWTLRGCDIVARSVLTGVQLS